MTVEGTSLAPLVAVVGLLYVRVVCDNEFVLVARTTAMGSNGRSRVVHSFADLWHSIFLQELFVILSCIDCLEFLHGSLV